MQSAATKKILESHLIELDPIRDGFGGVLVELCRQSSPDGHGDHFVLTETAAVSGNRLLRFTTASERRAREALARELFPETSSSSSSSSSSLSVLSHQPSG